MRVRGKDVMLYINDAPVALSTGCSLEVSCELAEKSSFLSGRAKCFIAGRYEWSVSCDKLFSAADFSALEMLKHGQEVTISMSAKIGGETYGLTGTALVSSWNSNAPAENMASSKIALQGSGELSALPLPTENP
jgi:predicted secreted protein